MTANVLIGLGANLPSPVGPPRATLEAALAALGRRGLRPISRSSWYESAPVPASDQPWFVNGVALCESELDPAGELALLLAVEREFGRVSRARNAARSIDLDLLAHGELVRLGPEPPLLPHPRLRERLFVLLPLAEVLPSWRHPADGRSVAQLIAALSPGQAVRRLPD